MDRVELDTSPMIWRLTLRTADGDRPVDIVMALTHIEDRRWFGEVRIDGYPGPETVFPIRACDWIQAHEMMLGDVTSFLLSYAEEGPLYWRGTSIPFEVPAWRIRRPSLPARLRARWQAWWYTRR